MIYLAAPYEKVEDKEALMEELAIIIGKCLFFGIPIYSPLTLGHAATKVLEVIKHLPEEHWRQLERSTMQSCEALYVYQREGWEESKGVRHEIELAKKLNLPIYKVTVKGINVEITDFIYQSA